MEKISCKKTEKKYNLSEKKTKTLLKLRISRTLYLQARRFVEES